MWEGLVRFAVNGCSSHFQHALAGNSKLRGMSKDAWVYPPYLGCVGVTDAWVYSPYLGCVGATDAWVYPPFTESESEPETYMLVVRTCISYTHIHTHSLEPLNKLEIPVSYTI